MADVTWRDTFDRLGLFARAHYVTPLRDTARRRRQAFALADIEARHVAEAARAAEAAKPRARTFNSAQFSRLTADWITGMLSADQEIKGDARRLRGGARMLTRDVAYARRFLKLVQRNVIGQGIQLQARLSTTRGGINDRVNWKAEDAWALWGEPEHCDIAGRLSWADILTSTVASVARDGEALIRIVEGADNPFGFALQVLDIDLLDDDYTLDGRKSPTGNEIRMGVEIDRWGKPVAYWLFTGHPSETTAHGRERTRVPAEEVIHLYVADRPGQTRGVTWFAAVMLDQKMLAGFLEAAVTAARIGASKMGAITYDPEKGGAPMEPEPGEPAVIDDVEPGRFWQLSPGQSVEAIDWQYPSETVDPFTKAILKSISAGLDVTYASLTGDLREVNYSSIRAGLLDERDAWRMLQGWVITHLCRRVWRRWLPFAALGGHIPASSVDALKTAVQFQPRGWTWVDPKKEIEAARIAVQEGFTTRSRVCAENGVDFEDNIDRLAEEQDYTKDAGVTLGEPETTSTPSNDDEGERPDGAAEADEDDARGVARRLRLARRIG